MNVTLRQMRVFAEVARRLSFVRAAEALHLTPPAVTMQVKELEAVVGLPLFERSGRQVSLTTAGEYLLLHARRMLAVLKDAEDAMARLKHVQVGRLDVGLVSTAKYFVPRLLVRFREQHPGVELKLHVSPNRERLVELLRGNEIDLAIMGRPPRELATRAEAFAAHPQVFVAPPDHPLLRLASVPAAALEAEPFIVREPGSGTRKHLEDFFERARIAPPIAMEMPSNESIKQAVMAGMGLSFLSLHTIGLEVLSSLLGIVKVEGTPIVRSWNVVHLSGRTLSPAAEALRYFVLEHGEAMLAAHDAPLMGARDGVQASAPAGASDGTPAGAPAAGRHPFSPV